MLSKILTILGLAAAGLLFIVLTTTSPSEGGAIAILAVFLLSYIVILCTLTFSLVFIGMILDRLYRQVGGSKYKPLSLKRAYYYSSVIALAPVIIISLQSVGEVGLYEIILVSLFVFLGCIYVARRADS